VAEQAAIYVNGRCSHSRFVR